MTYRSIWRWHFHAGLLCIPIVIVLALTGSIYLFKPQIDAFVDRDVDALIVTGTRATGEQHIAAALASLPGSRLFAYEVPVQADDAVRVHVYSADGSGRIVYVHPHTLEILKSIPHTARLTEIVRMIHNNLMAGRVGSVLIELAASWAIIMLGTGLYLWWPREGNGAAGVLYPRLRQGRRVLWRDLHAVTGVWVSSLAMFLLITALPWTLVTGEAIGKMRSWAAPTPGDWSTRPADEHAGHRVRPAGSVINGSLTVDKVIARIADENLDAPVRVYLPQENQPHWRVRSETQNRPRVRELQIDPSTGALVEEQKFSDKSLLDRSILVGIAAHEGQLFGPVNQLLGFLTATGLMMLSTSAVVMWWRRRPGGSLGIPAPRVPGFRIGLALRTGIVLLGLLLPVLGLSLVLLWIFDLATRRFTEARAAGP